MPRRYNAGPEAAIPNDAPTDDPLLPAIRQHERAIALRSEGRFAAAERASRASPKGCSIQPSAAHDCSRPGKPRRVKRHWM